MAQYCDNFRFYDGDNDSFEFWNGLRGPKGDPGAPGAPGSSVELRGPVATVGDLPASAPADELWMVGASSPYTGYFWNGSSWVDLGAILQGPQGEPGEDGVSPEIEIETITGGHTVTITDAEHPSGQSFDVMDGADGQPGQPGATGAAAGFGTPSATVDANVGTPSVEISASGPDTAKVFSFAFHNLKGEPGSGGGGADPYTDPPEDLGATPSAGSVNQYSRGDHVHQMPDADDVGAIPVPASTPSSGAVLTYDGSDWDAATPHYVPSGGSQGAFLQKTDAGNYHMQWTGFDSTNLPAMDSGSGAFGISNRPSRHDHVHPTDTSRAAADLGISGAAAGNLVKISTVSSGAPATFAPAAAGTDYQTPLTAGTDYQTPLTAGTDYEVPVKAGSIALSGTWSGSGPYSQTVTVTGATVTAASKIDLQPTATQLGTLITAGVTALVVENGGGSPVTLTAYAFGAAPSAMTVQCTVTEVS